MFRKIALIVLVGLLTTIYSADAQELVITGPWKLSFEDKKEFSSADWNDAGWDSLGKLEWADDHKTTANRTLWIRKKVVVPSSLKSAFAKTGVLSLSMGKIMQSDDTYLNGKAIGATGSGDMYRNYLLTPTDILWDKENTIAIRVRHWGQFKVSMVPKLEAALPDYFFLYNAGIKGADAKEPVLNRDGVYELYLTNRSPNKTEGLVTADFYDFSGAKLSSAQQKVAVGTGKNTVSFPYKSSSPFVKVVYTVAIPSYQYSHQWNSEAGYQNIAYKPAPPVVAYKAPQKYFPADISKQKLEGWLGDRLKANTEKRLYKVDEPALLAGFINRPGNHSWIGEHVGKFLDAACNAYANTADPALKIQIDRTAQQLIAAQLPDGYLGTYGPDSHWTSWDVWSHRYDLIGLLHYYEISGFKPALEASKKIGDLLMQTFGGGAGQKDLIKSGPHVGMAATCILESVGELYRFSGDKRYLNYCYYIIKSYDGPRGPRILTTLDSTGGRVDKVANAKAYEMLSNFLGIIKLYRLTADSQFLKPMVAAWKDIVASRLYITGTASSFEHFQDDDILPATNGDNMGEGCVTTTWVQFNYQLLCVTGEMKYLDELERSVYNHLTGAENPQTGGVSYYTPLVGVKPFGTGITCCMSSVPRGIAMIPFFAAGKISNIPTFLFYQPGRFVTSVKNRPVSFTTATAFPANGDVKILVDETMSAAYSLAFRKPWWSADFSIKVNGKAQAITAGETVNINRIWKKGDLIAVHFSMPLKVLEGGKTYPGKLAFQRGPQVLAFDKKLNATDAESVSVPASTLTPQPAPKALPAGWVGTESFEVKATTGNDTKSIILVPYADAGQTGGAISTWLKKETPGGK